MILFKKEEMKFLPSVHNDNSNNVLPSSKDEFITSRLLLQDKKPWLHNKLKFFICNTGVVLRIMTAIRGDAGLMPALEENF